MKIADIAVKRPIMMSMFILVFIIFGALSYYSLTLNQMPDVKIPYITISTVYPGAGPKEIETQISKKIEDAVSTISKIKNINSYSLEAVSIIVIEFEIGKDVDIANQEVKDKVDAIVNTLPDDIEKPIIQKVDLQALPVLDVVLSGGNDPRALYEVADKTLKDRFSQIEGVASVQLTGGQEREIQVKLDNRAVFENSLSLPQLMGILQAHNVDIPGGHFKLEGQEYTVRMNGLFSSPDAISELDIPTAFGPKKIRQIGLVEDAGKEVRERAVYFNCSEKLRKDNIVRMGIVKATDGNAVKVSQGIYKILPEIQKSLPSGMKLEIVRDDSDFIKGQVNDTLGNIWQGILLTGLVLLLFLHDIRSTIVVAVSMPISIVATFWMMDMSGFSLNVMSLMGLSVSIGTLVANSVVVIENIFRYKDMGLSNSESAIKGTNEVVVAVVASTMTNVVVFLPIAQMQSMVGMFFREFALTVTYATLFSMIMSFTLTPMLSSLILPKQIKLGKFSREFESIFTWFSSVYSKILHFVLSKKRFAFLTIIGAFVTLILVVMLLMPRIGFENFPAVDQGVIQVKVELPEGYDLDETGKVLQEIERRLAENKVVIQTITNLGKTGDIDKATNLALMDVKILDANQRDKPINFYVNEFIKQLADIPNAKIKVSSGGGVGDGQDPITFYLMGQNLEKLEEIKQEIVKKVQDVPGLVNFDQSSRTGKPEITIFPYRDKLAEAGLTAMDLAMSLRASLEGLVAAQYREAGQEYDIKVTMFDNSYNSPEKVKSLTIPSPSGVYRLSQLADVKFTTGFTKILHKDKFVTIQFTGAPAADIPLGNVTNEITKRIETIQMPDGYKIQWGGDAEMMEETMVEMMKAFFLAIILTYMLLAAILESMVQPAIIMMTLPLALIGVVASMFVTGSTMNTMSMMAIVMLIGIVVNNAILMLDYSNQLVHEKGMTHKEALLLAGPTKLKPIIMSTLAIILGMMPMALGIGDFGKEFRTPLGIVSIGGLLVSTLLTLFVIPAGDYLNNKLAHGIRKRWNLIRGK